MAYRLRPDGDFFHDASALLSALLHQAANLLDGHDTDNRHDAIHKARKKLKRARALLRLFKPAVSDLARAENRRLSSIAASLSAVRDATALIETTDDLLRDSWNERQFEALEELRPLLMARRDRIAENEADLATKMAQAAKGCREAATALDHIAFGNRPAKVAKMLKKAWRKTIRKALFAMEQCRQGSHGESYHDLRKATQTYWMHLALVADLWPSVFALKRERAKTLTDLLGHENDLSVLTAVIDRETLPFGSSETLAHLLEIIIGKQQSLRRDALMLAESLYADGEVLEAETIGTLWLKAVTERQA
ncbi:CHAD domain-containing protein [Allorhizobium sp. BGMRC 0089]|uniref:CHAD domain-containing protein n=1 Tax=Allorhizobium sonneratiae TaxID=2934936 RepID=UPI002034A46D|nr:CHAD domain-containing protein [Allorhizobium sonneratiae]MCM2290803.1 CHAD domain-containing protein [Allorhizobium sonneratiae]